MNKPSNKTIIKLLNNPIFILCLVFAVYFFTGTGIDYQSEQVQNIMTWTKSKPIKSKELEVIKTKMNSQRPTVAIMTPEEMQIITTELKKNKERAPADMIHIEKPTVGHEFNPHEIAAILRQMDEEALEIEAPPEEILALAEGLGKNWKQVFNYKEVNNQNLPDELKNHRENLKDYNNSIDNMMQE